VLLLTRINLAVCPHLGHLYCLGLPQFKQLLISLRSLRSSVKPVDILAQRHLGHLRIKFFSINTLEYYLIKKQKTKTMSETSKIRNKISKYLKGAIYDIGCGNDKITTNAIGIDGRSVFEGGVIQEGLTNFPSSMNETADVVYSSHTLEHMENDYETIVSWSKLLKKKGVIILYLPDGRYYNNYANLEHMRDYQYEQFMMFFRRAFCGEGKNFKGENLPAIFKILEDGPDVGEDRYSFYLVAEKI